MRKPILLILSIGVISAFVLGMQRQEAGRDGNEIANIPALPEPTALETKLLFAGDIYWGRLFERDHPNDYGFPFSGLHTLKKSNYDAWIANLECPVTDEFVSFEDQWEAIQFNCQPEYLKQASKWFDVVSLANNHTDNVRGEEGLFETRANLKNAGIQYFGHYEPSVLNDLCEIVDIQARLHMSDGSEQATKLPIALCGYHGVFRQFTDNEIAHIKNYAPHFITFAMPHAGAEYQPTSDEFRETAYRAMIDAGADAVFGNHPHWVQNTEVHNGKLIAYSMGNFIFDQQFNDEVTRSAAFKVSLSLDYSEDLQNYIDAFDTRCATYQDDCLQTAIDLQLVKPDYAVDYSIIPTRTTNLVTSLDAAGKASILERTFWDQTHLQLQ